MIPCVGFYGEVNKTTEHICQWDALTNSRLRVLGNRFSLSTNLKLSSVIKVSFFLISKWVKVLPWEKKVKPISHENAKQTYRNILTEFNKNYERVPQRQAYMKVRDQKSNISHLIMKEQHSNTCYKNINMTLIHVLNETSSKKETKRIVCQHRNIFTKKL